MRNNRTLSGVLWRIVAVSTLAVAAVATIGNSAASGSTRSLPLDPGTHNELSGVAAISATDVWAVGWFDTGSYTRTLALHWNGAFWKRTWTPNPDPSGDALRDVAAISSNDVWAVGTRGHRSLTIRWDGRRWWRVSSPSPGGIDNELSGVVAIASDDVWAVGFFRDHVGSRTLAIHWDGSRWTKSNTRNPSPIVNDLQGVAAISSTDVWAVGNAAWQGRSGEPVVLRWNGTGWSRVATPIPPDGLLFAVSVSSTNDALAVGDSWTSPMSMRWDGSGWSLLATPGASASLRGVTSLSSTDSWAVGSGTQAGQRIGIVVRFDGSNWSQVTDPMMAYNHWLDDVDATSSTDAWAVGTYYTFADDVYHTLVLHWNGIEWQQAE